MPYQHIQSNLKFILNYIPWFTRLLLEWAVILHNSFRQWMLNGKFIFSLNSLRHTPLCRLFAGTTKISEKNKWKCYLIWDKLDSTLVIMKFSHFSCLARFAFPSLPKYFNNGRGMRGFWDDFRELIAKLFILKLYFYTLKKRKVHEGNWLKYF